MEVYPWEWLLPRIDSDDHATACVGTADEISQRPWEVDGQALRPDDGLPYAMSLFDPSVDVTSVDPRTMVRVMHLCCVDSNLSTDLWWWCGGVVVVVVAVVTLLFHSLQRRTLSGCT